MCNSQIILFAVLLWNRWAYGRFDSPQFLSSVGYKVDSTLEGTRTVTSLDEIDTLRTSDVSEEGGQIYPAFNFLRDTEAWYSFCLEEKQFNNDQPIAKVVASGRVKQVILRCCKIGSKGLISILTSSLANSSSVEWLTISNCYLDDKVLSTFSPVGNSSLTVLDMSFNNLQNENIILVLVKVLESSPNLKTLALDGNPLLLEQSRLSLFLLCMANFNILISSCRLLFQCFIKVFIPSD